MMTHASLIARIFVFASIAAIWVLSGVLAATPITGPGGCCL
jgi:hypothetical protein